MLFLARSKVVVKEVKRGGNRQEMEREEPLLVRKLGSRTNWDASQIQASRGLTPH